MHCDTGSKMLKKSNIREVSNEAIRNFGLDIGLDLFWILGWFYFLLAFLSQNFSRGRGGSFGVGLWG